MNVKTAKKLLNQKQVIVVYSVLLEAAPARLFRKRINVVNCKTMIEIKRTTSDDRIFQELVELLDKELLSLYPEIQNMYRAHAEVAGLDTVILIYNNNEAAGCGCFLPHPGNLMEIKRMYVHPLHRGKGISKIILNELEKWAMEKGFNISILETGKKQNNAIKLYTKSGYTETENYGPYKDFDNSICFKKILTNQEEKNDRSKY